MIATQAAPQHLAVTVPVDLQFKCSVVSLVEVLVADEPSRVRHQIASALQEAFAHVGEHSGLGRNDCVELYAARTDDQIVIELVDAGARYDSDFLAPCQADTEWDLPAQQMRAALIQRCVDEARYERTDRNVLRLVKQLSTSDDGRTEN